MKQQYKIEAVNPTGLAVLDVNLHCTQYQVRRVYMALAFAMATDGEWRSLRVRLQRKDGTAPVLYGERG